MGVAVEHGGTMDLLVYCATMLIAYRFNPLPLHWHVATLGKSFTHMPLFIKQYKLLPANGGDALKLGR